MALLAMLIAISGCATTSGMDEREPAAAASAAEAFRAGDFAGAAALYEAAADRGTARQNYFLLRVAESWREAGDDPRTDAAIARVEAAKLEPAYDLRYRLLAAEAALRAGRGDDAAALVDRRSGQVDAAFRGRWRDVRIAALEADNQPAAAAVELAESMDESGVAAGDEDDRLRQLLGRSSDQQLRDIANELTADHRLAPMLVRALNLRHLRIPDALASSTGAGRGWLAANRLLPSPDFEGYRSYRHVALLVPESGSAAAAATALRDGFFAGYFSEGRSRPEVTVFDAGDSAATALAAYERATQAGAEIVIGPLTRDAVTALFRLPHLPVPVLALNRPEADVSPPPGAASFALAPEDDGIAMAERLAQRNVETAVVITGADQTARRAAQSFTGRFADRGGRVVASIDYYPGGEGRTAAAIADAFRGNPGAALVLALDRSEARTVVPAIRALPMPAVFAVSTASLADGRGDTAADRELDNIEFPYFPWLLGDRIGLPSQSTLARSLPTARGAAARLFAFGIDAFRLIGFIDHLAENRDAEIEGATGQLRLSPFAFVERRPAWARFSNGRIVASGGGLLLQPAPPPIEAGPDPVSPTDNER